jgi:hypothetical protein
MARLDRHLENLSYPPYLAPYPLIAMATAHFAGSWRSSSLRFRSPSLSRY